MEDDVAELMKLSDDVRSVLHGDGPRTQFEYELAWVRTYLKKVGMVENSERGVWRLTQKGLTAPDSEIVTVPQQVRAAEQERRRNKADKKRLVKARRLSSKPSEEEEEEEEADPSWKEQLLDLLITVKPAAFERLAQRILRESGFVKVEVTGRTGDGGIDGMGVLRVNLLSFHVFFQCKRWKGSVGASTVRDFRGAMVGRADKGLVITTGTFTAEARREATRDGAPAIDLVDGDTLCELLKMLKIGVSVEQIEHVIINEGIFAEL
jgi:restriction system protein